MALAWPGATAGIGLAAFGPSATLAVATTFGTASTGNSHLRLVRCRGRQRRRRLAWRRRARSRRRRHGDGAHALLALTGPVGWTVGGLALVGSGTYLHYRKRCFLRRMPCRSVIRVEGENPFPCGRPTGRSRGWEQARGRTRRARWLSLGWLGDYAPHDYRQFDPGQKETSRCTHQSRSLAQRTDP